MIPTNPVITTLVSEHTVDPHTETLMAPRSWTCSARKSRTFFAPLSIRIEYEQLTTPMASVDELEQQLAALPEDESSVAETTSLLKLGRLYHQKKEPETPLGFLDQALAFSTELGAKAKMYQSHEVLSETHAALGDYAIALEHAPPPSTSRRNQSKATSSRLYQRSR